MHERRALFFVANFFFDLIITFLNPRGNFPRGNRPIIITPVCALCWSTRTVPCLHRKTGRYATGLTLSAVRRWALRARNPYNSVLCKISYYHSNKPLMKSLLYLNTVLLALSTRTERSECLRACRRLAQPATAPSVKIVDALCIRRERWLRSNGRTFSPRTRIVDRSI